MHIPAKHQHEEDTPKSKRNDIKNSIEKETPTRGLFYLDY